MSSECFNVIKSPTDCEIRLKGFPTSRNVLAVDFDCYNCQVCKPYAMSDSKVRNQARKFKGGRENVHDELLRPTIFNHNLFGYYS